ncbi:hypothetical protein [Chelativorans xinjiangense]|uniref:hypothetical protein n=1 Tax=Chelativorans xinjiangense TaxID=2681485 RepID=UPI0013596A54|nr:hypothetical protein [Chelativorans xinjiangense]
MPTDFPSMKARAAANRKVITDAQGPIMSGNLMFGKKADPFPKGIVKPSTYNNRPSKGLQTK